ncbi:hypothetical protein CROQUDRAFT_661551 [Cronartium quercuum f. sp. fusiforme G11]|uniref:protein-tyrosine-phosphatase n=1 Tax=Cronartium quercuum f. sp. fusiforme G11 TaxID=708437 RepID=A0A9P6NGI2_9BASI|nr:hypothetical protein CROQUDRAFT_661551 [Cronartium quercuum f. sp. fusiforme G11]
MTQTDIDFEIHMHNIIPRLYIGDFTASQSLDLLRQSNIRNIVAAMKQSYLLHPGFELLRVPIDDTDRTNICEWFDVVGNWIQSRLDSEDGYGVLVHCAAGVSRSTTLVAAYLMKAQNLTAEEAVFYISSKRPQVQPTEFFIHQLEMYERCNCQWDPAKYQEQRRFVMGFVADEMRDGTGAQKLVLAYYPSPAPSPRDKNTSDPFSSFAMTPLNPEAIHSKLTSPSALTHNLNPDPTQPPAPPLRQRFTKRGQSQIPDPLSGFKQAKETNKLPQVEKLGQGQVTIKGRRIRCKMCRRELAARDHILSHRPGEGQSAFAPQKRDMNKFRDEAMEKLRSQNLTTESSAPPAIDQTDEKSVKSGGMIRNSSTEPTRGFASLRVSMPPRPANLSISESDQFSTVSTSIHHHPTAAFITATETTALTSPPLITSHQCSSYFVEPLSWMSTVLEKGELVGKIVCPNNKCISKLGNFDWAGCQCSCGAWITPGFQISRSKVDEI